MRSNSQRTALVKTGRKLVHEQGFSRTGVREIAAAADVPQGSFTNHFRSKDVFGKVLLDDYYADIFGIMQETLEDTSKSPLERVLGYFQAARELLAEGSWRQGCLIVDLMADATPHYENIRGRLCEILNYQTSRFAEVLGELLPPDSQGAADLASFLIAAWHGTLLRVKTERNPSAIDRFERMMLQFVSGSRKVGHPNKQVPKPSSSRSRGLIAKK
jgi:TetR/AcrR family transcriptional regulator, transcriptional repressor for nem operon